MKRVSNDCMFGLTDGTEFCCCCGNVSNRLSVTSVMSLVSVGFWVPGCNDRFESNQKPYVEIQ